MSPTVIILVLFAYLLGSVPFSQLITGWRTGLNLREVGSGCGRVRSVSTPPARRRLSHWQTAVLCGAHTSWRSHDSYAHLDISSGAANHI
jgi:hypothetical protein